MVHVQVDGFLGILCDPDCILHSESKIRKSHLRSSSSEPKGLHMGKLKSQETTFRDQNPCAAV